MPRRKYDKEAHVAIATAYIHGRVEAQLEGFAASLGIPTRQLTERVGQLLIGTEGRSALGLQPSVRHMRREAPEAHQGTREVAVADGTHENRARVAEEAAAANVRIAKRFTITDGRRKRGKAARSAQKAYWAKMTPKQRKAEMARRMKVRMDKLAGAEIEERMKRKG